MVAAVQTMGTAINVCAHLDLQGITVNTIWDTVLQNLVPMVARVTHLGKNSGAAVLHHSTENSAKLRAVRTDHVRTKAFAMNLLRVVYHATAQGLVLRVYTASSLQQAVQLNLVDQEKSVVWMGIELSAVVQTLLTPSVIQFSPVVPLLVMVSL